MRYPSRKKDSYVNADFYIFVSDDDGLLSS